MSNFLFPPPPKSSKIILKNIYTPEVGYKNWNPIIRGLEEDIYVQSW